MYCEKCGAKVSDTASFCSSCGSKINNGDKKIYAFKCPNCDAPINIDSYMKSGITTLYCEHCGCKCVLDDGIIRSEKTININNTYRKIDEAKVINAKTNREKLDWEKKQYKYENERKRKKRKAIIAVVIVAIIAALSFPVSSFLKLQINENRIERLTKQVYNVVSEHGMSVDHVSLYNGSAHISLIANTYYKNDLDIVEQEIIPVCQNMSVDEYSIYFFDSENNVIRSGNGTESTGMSYWIDNTNTVTAETANQKEGIYAESIEGICEEHKLLQFQDVNYEQDQMVITIKTMVLKGGITKKFEEEIIQANNNLDQEPLKIEYVNKKGKILKTTQIDENGSIKNE